ncbi:MAG: Bax inhibitor-1/YccA family protein [Bacteroidota bacterium]|nr:Bax inhibitor-1/YccA family protein [Bacteroidota bacterium]
MENQFQFNNSVPQTQEGAIPKTFVANVFSWMAFALGISGALAYMFGTDASLMESLFERGRGMTALGYVVMFAPIGLVLVMNMAMQRLSFPVLLILFTLFAVSMGMSLSFVFMVYKLGSIFQIFLISSGMFGAMAVLGYTTKTDLTKLGSLLMMALFGIIIASVINMFVGSRGMSLVISFISVIVFTGLTAYDVQKIKTLGSQVEAGTETTAKLSILAAMGIYLDFINIFLALLNLFGDRK